MNNMQHLLTRWRSRLLVYLTHNMALPVLRLIRKPKIFPYSAGELQHFPAGSLGNDIKHIVLQYDTTDDGEVCLQCFMLGNGHISFPVAATVLYGLITMLKHWKKFGAAYRRGKKAIPIANWNWFEILHEPTTVLIKKINS
jgi:ubiquinone biosynthesis protein Coq4